MAKPVDILPRALCVESNWQHHSVCTPVKVGCKLFIQQYQLRANFEFSAEFPVGEEIKDSGGMVWKLSLNAEGIHIAHSIFCPGQPMTFTGNCKRSFYVTCGIVTPTRTNGILIERYMIEEGMKMPVNIYAVPRDEGGAQQWNQDDDIVMENGDVNIYCKIETYKDEKELTSRSVNVGPNVSSNEELVNHLKKLFESMKFSDITFKVRGQEFQAHKNILSTRSPVFAAMFEHQTMSENVTGIVDVVDVEPEVFKIMLCYIYTGQLYKRQLDEVATELLAAADKYQLEKMKYECRKHMKNWMSPENCLKLFLLDENHPASYLKGKASNFIRRNSSKVMSSKSWKKAEEENPQRIMEIQKMLIEHQLGKRKQQNIL